MLLLSLRVSDNPSQIIPPKVCLAFTRLFEQLIEQQDVERHTRSLLGDGNGEGDLDASIESSFKLNETEREKVVRLTEGHKTTEYCLNPRPGRLTLGVVPDNGKKYCAPVKMSSYTCNKH